MRYLASSFTEALTEFRCFDLRLFYCDLCLFKRILAVLLPLNATYSHVMHIGSRLDQRDIRLDLT